jgi:hypothetical protein
MNKTLFRNLGHVALAAMLAAPIGANAESTFQTGAGALSTSARVDFQITIPRFLSLRVGTAGAPVDLVNFTVPAANVGNATPVAGTGGDLGAGSVTASVLGNGGNVTLQATTAGPIGNGSAGTIDWSQITTASSNPSLPAPVLANGASAGVAVAAANGVVNQAATWTYSFANSDVIEAGTYGGVNTNNSRVTYTASVP